MPTKQPPRISEHRASAGHCGVTRRIHTPEKTDGTPGKRYEEIPDPKPIGIYRAYQIEHFAAPAIEDRINSHLKTLLAKSTKENPPQVTSEEREKLKTNLTNETNNP